jgi:hypothetical protein
MSLPAARAAPAIAGPVAAGESEGSRPLPSGRGGARPVSRLLAGSNGRPYVEVDGRPFLPLVVQFRVDAHIGGDRDLSEAVGYFADAKAVGFNTISVPVYWRWIEQVEGSFDWWRVDSFIDAAHQYGLRLELLWFGTNIAGGAVTSPVEFATVPQWVIDDAERFPRHVNSDGTVSERPGGVPGGVGVYSALSLAGSRTLAAECDAVSAMMEHVASYDRRHAVIGVQVNNEPLINASVCSAENEDDRSYDPLTTAAFASGGLSDGREFALSQLADWLNTLARAVKMSDYPVYTRVNYWGHGCGASFRQVAERAPHIDFAGCDPYTSDVATIRNLIGANAQFHGYAIPENGPYPETPALMLSVFDAGGVFYSIYSLVDGDSGIPGVVRPDHSWTPVASIIHEFFGQLVKDEWGIATHQPGVDIAYFHVRDTDRASSEVRVLQGIRLEYVTDDGGIGVAIVHGTDLYVMGIHGSGSLTIAHWLPVSAEAGSFDRCHVWLSDVVVPFSDNHDGTFGVDVSRDQLIRLHYGQRDDHAPLTALFGEEAQQ